MTESRIITGELLATGTPADFIGDDIMTALDDVEEPTSPFRLLMLLARAEANGILGIRTGEETIAINLSGGLVTKTASDEEDEDEALAAVLINGKLLTREKLIRAAEQADEDDEELARVIFKRGFMDARDMVKALRLALRRQVFRALNAKQASYTFARQDALGKGTLKASPTHTRVQVLLRDYMATFLRAYHHSDLAEALQPYAARWLEVPASHHDYCRRLGFDKREIHTIEELLDGSHRAEEVVRMSVMSKNAVARLLMVCGALGLLSTHDHPTKEAKILSEEERLEQMLHELLTTDHFEVLQCHWSAHIAQLEREFRLLTKEYGPNGSLRTQGPPIATVAAKIWALMEEAWRVLKDKRARVHYRASLLEASQLRHAAELLFDQGRTYQLQHRWDEARERYEASMELAPSERGTKALANLDARMYAWMKKSREHDAG